ncbi:MAG: GGDEF domain-containing protein [Candidatus Limivicinus sp.]
MKVKMDKGISLRTTHLILVIVAIIVSGLMFYATFHLSVSFRNMAQATEEQIELRKAARELMDASDYLTEKVQRFTVNGDMRFLEEYFTEAFETNRREEAVNTMSVVSGNEDALRNLQEAMDGSLELMNLEYYAMRLVIDAKGYSDYPDVLRSVMISDEDRALSGEEKMRRAVEIVLGDEYYEQKDRIRQNMKASLDELERMAYDTDAATLESFSKEMAFVRVIISIQIISIFIIVWLTARLGIHPVLNAVERIKADSPIPEVGANEFRYLARAYNKMYEVYKSSLERLNFKASHDELTGAYNRAGYDLLLSSLDLSSTYMLLFDVDNFKSINDTYGHEVGDKVLVKLVQVMKKNFRSDDYICRIGGDEFVVFMVHATEQQKNLIASKIEKINQEMTDPKDGLPPASISVGITYGAEAEDAEVLFEKADAAMYHSKQSGKSTYTFEANA